MSDSASTQPIQPEPPINSVSTIAADAAADSDNNVTRDLQSITTANAGNSLSTSKTPRDSNGWDGKLRISRISDPSGADEDSGGEDISDAEEQAKPEEVVFGEAIDADEDLAAEFEDDADEIDLIHCRISSIPALKLERFKNLEKLCLRQNKITKIEFPPNIGTKLKELDLYDNLIKYVHGSLENFEGLTTLDLSFNNLKKIEGVGHLVELTDIFLVQNRIRKIEHLEKLQKLRNLELGGNKITTIEGLESLTSLEELWLGKNRITEFTNLSTLSNLKILSIQANRLHSLTGLEALTTLEELYVSHNAITSLDGLAENTSLRIIDISANPIEHLTGLETLKELEEVWASSCKLESFEEVEQQLGDKEKLTTVYLEGNPLQKRQPVLYRNKVKLALPRLTQIDATMVNAGPTLVGARG